MGWVIVEIITVAVLILLVAVVVIFVAKPKSGGKEDRGKEGEYRVGNVLEKIAGEEDIVINDYLFQGVRITVQIDHLLISRRGVFVIETKNYSGEIYGEAEQKEWMQVLAYGNVKNKFRNPVKQNAGHIYNLKKILPKGTPVYGLVVFVQNNTDHIRAEGVVPLSGLREAISGRKEDALTSAQIQRIASILERRSLKDKISEERHIGEIRQMIYGVEHNIVCPRCGGKLVEKEGKYGRFIGCSNYPACTFTKKAE